MKSFYKYPRTARVTKNLRTFFVATITRIMFHLDQRKKRKEGKNKGEPFVRNVQRPRSIPVCASVRQLCNRAKQFLLRSVTARFAPVALQILPQRRFIIFDAVAGKWTHDITGFLCFQSYYPSPLHVSRRGSSRSSTPVVRERS